MCALSVIPLSARSYTTEQFCYKGFSRSHILLGARRRRRSNDPTRLNNAQTVGRLPAAGRNGGGPGGRLNSDRPGAGRDSGRPDPATSWDKKPDLNGIWQALNTANWDLETHPGGPHRSSSPAYGALVSGVSVVEGGRSVQAGGAGKREQNRKNALPGKPGRNEVPDPELNCFLPGVPARHYLPHPFQIMQSPNRMWMVYRYSYARREIFMNGKESADRLMDGIFERAVGWRHPRDRREGPGRSVLVRPGGQLSFRRAASR